MSQIATSSFRAKYQYYRRPLRVEAQGVNKVADPIEVEEKDETVVRVRQKATTTSEIVRGAAKDLEQRHLNVSSHDVENNVEVIWLNEDDDVTTSHSNQKIEGVSNSQKRKQEVDFGSELILTPEDDRSAQSSGSSDTRTHKRARLESSTQRSPVYPGDTQGENKNPSPSIPDIGSHRRSISTRNSQSRSTTSTSDCRHRNSYTLSDQNEDISKGEPYHLVDMSPEFFKFHIIKSESEMKSICRKTYCGTLFCMWGFNAKNLLILSRERESRPKPPVDSKSPPGSDGSPSLVNSNLDDWLSANIFDRGGSWILATNAASLHFVRHHLSRLLDWGSQCRLHGQQSSVKRVVVPTSLVHVCYWGLGVESLLDAWNKYVGERRMGMFEDVVPFISEPGKAAETLDRSGRFISKNEMIRMRRANKVLQVLDDFSSLDAFKAWSYSHPNDMFNTHLTGQMVTSPGWVTFCAYDNHRYPLSHHPLFVPSLKLRKQGLVFKLCNWPEGLEPWSSLLADRLKEPGITGSLKLLLLGLPAASGSTSTSTMARMASTTDSQTSGTEEVAKKICRGYLDVSLWRELARQVMGAIVWTCATFVLNRSRIKALEREALEKLNIEDYLHVEFDSYEHEETVKAVSRQIAISRMCAQIIRADCSKQREDKGSSYSNTLPDIMVTGHIYGLYEWGFDRGNGKLSTTRVSDSRRAFFLRLMLELGIPIVKVEWLSEICRQGHVVDPTPFAIPVAQIQRAAWSMQASALKELDVCDVLRKMDLSIQHRRLTISPTTSHNPPCGVSAIGGGAADEASFMSAKGHYGNTDDVSWYRGLENLICCEDELTSLSAVIASKQTGRQSSICQSKLAPQGIRINESVLATSADVAEAAVEPRFVARASVISNFKFPDAGSSATQSCRTSLSGEETAAIPEVIDKKVIIQAAEEGSDMTFVVTKLYESRAAWAYVSVSTSIVSFVTELLLHLLECPFLEKVEALQAQMLSVCCDVKKHDKSECVTLAKIGFRKDASNATDWSTMADVVRFIESGDRGFLVATPSPLNTEVNNSSISWTKLLYQCVLEEIVAAQLQLKNSEKALLLGSITPKLLPKIDCFLRQSLGPRELIDLGWRIIHLLNSWEIEKLFDDQPAVLTDDIILKLSPSFRQQRFKSQKPSSKVIDLSDPLDSGLLSYLHLALALSLADRVNEALTAVNDTVFQKLGSGMLPSSLLIITDSALSEQLFSWTRRRQVDDAIAPTIETDTKGAEEPEMGSLCIDDLVGYGASTQTLFDCSKMQSLTGMTYDIFESSQEDNRNPSFSRDWLLEQTAAFKVKKEHKIILEKISKVTGA